MRILDIHVVPKASRNSVVENNGGVKVYVTAAAVGGKANKAVIELLAEFYGVKKSRVRIVSGLRSRKKTIEVS